MKSLEEFSYNADLDSNIFTVNLAIVHFIWGSHSLIQAHFEAQEYQENAPNLFFIQSISP